MHSKNKLKIRMCTFAKMGIDEEYMQRCLELASLGAGNTSPNPMVGAVLVHNGEIIGEGYHQNLGGKHAEVNAIESVPDTLNHLFPQAILYVTLEPCSHFGKTPPCCDFILEKKIQKVVIGSLDPNPLVNGEGYTKLTNAGIDVRTGVLEKECRELNKYFFTFHEKKRPHITLKWAQSKDGFLAGTNFKQIHFTNVHSDILVHKMRSEHAAIFAGGRTVLTDNPELTVRNWDGKSPVRLSFDSKGTFPPGLKIYTTSAKTIVFNFNKTATNNNVYFVKIHKDESYVKQIVEYIYYKQLNSIFVEGGAQTLRDFISAGFWDEAKIFLTGHVLQEGISAPAIPGRIISSEEIFDNTLITSAPV